LEPLGAPPPPAPYPDPTPIPHSHSPLPFPTPTPIPYHLHPLFPTPMHADKVSVLYGREGLVSSIGRSLFHYLEEPGDVTVSCFSLSPTTGAGVDLLAVGAADGQSGPRGLVLGLITRGRDVCAYGAALRRASAIPTFCGVRLRVCSSSLWCLRRAPVWAPICGGVCGLWLFPVLLSPGLRGLGHLRVVAPPLLPPQQCRYVSRWCAALCCALACPLAATDTWCGAWVCCARR
jgi:hypothetical protein